MVNPFFPKVANKCNPLKFFYWKFPGHNCQETDALSSFHTSSNRPFQSRFLFMGQILWPQLSKKWHFVHFTHFLVDMWVGGGGNHGIFFPFSKNKYAPPTRILFHIVCTSFYHTWIGFQVNLEMVQYNIVYPPSWNISEFFLKCEKFWK
jgi:hypothetical protein